jgi:hypothetical protein
MPNFLFGKKRNREIEPFENVREMPSKRQASSQEVIDLADDRQDTPLRRQMLGRKVINIEDYQELLPAENQPLAPAKVDLTSGKEIYDGHPETRGSGSKYNPYTFVEWTGDGVIAAVDQGAHFNLVSDDEEEHVKVQRPVSLTRSPSPLFVPRSLSLRCTPRTDLEVHVSDNLGWPSPSSSRTVSPAPTCEGYEEAKYPDDDYIVILDDEDDVSGEYTYSQDWTTVKIEPEDNVSNFSSSRVLEEVAGLPTPASSQESENDMCEKHWNGLRVINNETLARLEEDLPNMPKKAGKLPINLQISLTEDQKLTKKALLVAKKTTFYFQWGPKNLPQLRNRIARFRQDHPENRGKDECWLYSGSVREGQGALETSVIFREEEHPFRRFLYTVNIAYLSMMVDGYMTDEFKYGIIHHAWHASHLCGNWTCTNPRHIIAEDGGYNSGRNPCFHGKNNNCTHSPPCRKHLRVEPQPGTREYFQALKPGEPNISLHNYYLGRMV